VVWKVYQIRQPRAHFPDFPQSPQTYDIYDIFRNDVTIKWTAIAQWKVAGSIPAGVIGIFHWHKILPIALWPRGRISLQQKWVPGAFPGGKGGRCVRLTSLPPSCAVVMKSENLNFLEPSGPHQACNGTALPFYVTKKLHLSVCATYTKEPIVLKLAINNIALHISSPHYYLNFGPSMYWHAVSEKLKGSKKHWRYLIQNNKILLSWQSCGKLQILLKYSFRKARMTHKPHEVFWCVDDKWWQYK